jgi:hypothetical protein
MINELENHEMDKSLVQLIIICFVAVTLIFWIAQQDDDDEEEGNGEENIATDSRVTFSLGIESNITGNYTVYLPIPLTLSGNISEIVDHMDHPNASFSSIQTEKGPALKITLNGNLTNETNDLNNMVYFRAIVKDGLGQNLSLLHNITNTDNSGDRAESYYWCFINTTQGDFYVSLVGTFYSNSVTSGEISNHYAFYTPNEMGDNGGNTTENGWQLISGNYEREHILTCSDCVKEDVDPFVRLSMLLVFLFTVVLIGYKRLILK